MEAVTRPADSAARMRSHWGDLENSERGLLERYLKACSV